MPNRSLLTEILALVIISQFEDTINANVTTYLPPEVKDCFDLIYSCNKVQNLTDEKVNHMCLTLANENGNGYIAKPGDVDYFLSLLNDMVNEERRYRRRARYPGRRLRQRREIRRMTSYQWRRFVQAVQSLKQKGKYDSIAAIHRGFDRLNKAHGGAAFLSWHRIYLLVFEHALRRERSGVTIPYWNSGFDHDMSDPTKSILWTKTFLGNCDGKVVTGPFQWKSGQGDDLIRNCGSGGTLISYDHYNNILTRKRHSEIMDPSTPQYWLEGIHNGPHVWVGGLMSLLDSAAEEPAFWLHHCYIDYIWQQFMDKQIKRTGNKNYPYYDYPPAQGGHNANARMDPFQITNRAGHHQYWYNNFYRYEKSPTCRNRCGSKYLKCNVKLQRCVSVKGRGRQRPRPRPRPTRPRGKIDVLATGASARPNLRMGRKFVSPFTDPRTSNRQPLRQAPSRSFSKTFGTRRRLKPTVKSTSSVDFSFLKVKLAKRSADNYEQSTVTAADKITEDVCFEINELIKYLT